MICTASSASWLLVLPCQKYDAVLSELWLKEKPVLQLSVISNPSGISSWFTKSCYDTAPDLAENIGDMTTAVSVSSVITLEDDLFVRRCHILHYLLSELFLKLALVLEKMINVICPFEGVFGFCQFLSCGMGKWKVTQNASIFQVHTEAIETRLPRSIIKVIPV